MLFRFVVFFSWQLAGGLLGWWKAGPWGAAVGAGIAAWSWFAWDMVRGCAGPALAAPR